VLHARRWSHLIRCWFLAFCSVQAVAAEPEVDVDVRAVSTALGLFDVEVRSSSPLRSGEVLGGFSGVGGGVSLDRRPELDGDGVVGYAARVLGAGLGSVSVDLETREGDRVRRRVGVPGAATGRDRPAGRSVGPSAKPPAWSLGRVWYQVFPERFSNGDPANDPDTFGGTVLPWDAPWYETEPIEIEAAWNRRLSDPRVFGYGASRAGGAFDAVVFQRRYGGDLQGVVERLDHIRSLGADGLYLCPVFASRSLHKYDARDHRHVDPAFGPAVSGRDVSFDVPDDPADETTWLWTAGDRYLVDVVIPEARARGMRVMLDGVWNHVGLDHWAFRDVQENGRASPFAEWFDADFDHDGRLVGWEGWSRRNGPLPEFLQVGGDLNAGAKAHLFAVTRRWMDPNGDGDPSDGIDGWRLDVAAEVGRAFWKDWRALVKSINPEALIVAEIWHDADAWFDGTAFDAQMQYPFAFAGTDWLGRTPGFDAAGFVSAMERVTGTRRGIDLAQLTLLASHDTERLASMLSNPRGDGFYDRGASRGDVWAGRYEPEPTAAALERSVLGAALQAVWPGSPMVYGGDEWGLPGADDPSNRVPIPWDTVTGDPAAVGVRDEYAAWFGLRDDAEVGPVLRYGSVRRVEHPHERVLAVSRRLNGVRVVAVLNAADRPVRASGIAERWGVRRALVGGESSGVLPARSAVAWIAER